METGRLQETVKGLPKGARRAPAPGRVGAYLLAGLCVALSVVARAALDPFWGAHYPYIMAFVAVFVAIQLGGVRVFLFAVVSSFVLADWFFVAPRQSMLISGATNQINSVLFFVITTTMLYFTERIRRALGREQAARKELGQHALALSESRARFEHLFEQSPAPTWVEDWAGLKQWLEQVRNQGVVELGAYLQDNPECVRQALGLVRVLDANEAAVRLTRAASKAELVANLPKLFTGATYQGFTRVLRALWGNQYHIEHESGCQRLDGEGLELMVRIDVPRRGADQEFDFANVIVTATDITERKKAEREREQLVGQLQGALAQVKTLSGLLPICAHCKRIRDDQGYWNQIELYIRRHSNANFTHGICPECAKEHYPELYSV
jgi:PAS domain-containing protein